MITSLVKKLLSLFKKKKPLFKHLRAIRLKRLWNEYGMGEGRRIAVFDLPGYHGEAVTEIIRRIAPKSQILFYSWIKSNGLTQIAEQARQILGDSQQSHIDVVNMSFATGDTREFREAIKNLYDNKTILVAASGNDPKYSYYPASYVEYVISTGSLNHKTGKISPFTSEPYEIAAPGEYIRGLDGQGTSFASPHIAGIAALMMSKIPFYQIESKIIEWLWEKDE